MGKFSKAIAISCALLVMGTSMSAMPFSKTTTVEATETYNYAKGLQYSMYLYDANMCGTGVDESSALSWRDDCHTGDASVSTSYGTLDLSGGYHDAGDHVKFGLPQAYSASVLGWGYYEFKDGYTSTGQADHLKTISTYFADYFKNCTVLDSSGNVTAFCYQVGDGDSDHLQWCSPEDQNIDRPVQLATSSNPATDIVSNTAGALAFNYMNFGDTESLTYAKALYKFAKNNTKQVASQGIGSFYQSDSYIDDLMWSAAALYLATGDKSYISDANTFLNEGDVYKFCSDWPLCWGNMWPVVNLIFGNLDSGINNNAHLDWGSLNPQMMEQVAKTLDNFQSGSTTLDGVYTCKDDWGSARYNTAMQLVGLVYDKYNNTSKYTSWAKSQMDYLMGDNSKNLCYITGFADNSVTNPHHRAASGLSDFPTENTTITMGNTLIGALVGGPMKDGSYEDKISLYKYTEVAIDYNAGFVGAMAGLYLQYGAGQSVDSSIEGVSGGSSQTTTTTTTTVTTTGTTSVNTTTSNGVNTTTSNTTTTTTAPTPSTTDVNYTYNVEQNTDGTSVGKIVINTGDYTSVNLNLSGGKAGATTSGEVGYWDNNASKWVGKVFTWEEAKFDSNGNLTIEGITVPANTKDVQIMITYYADWSSGSENLLDKSSIKIDSIEGVSNVVTTTTSAPNTTSSTTYTTSSTPVTTTTTSSNSNIDYTYNVEENTDGTSVGKITIDTGNFTTVDLNLTGGKPGATTSGEVGYWDNNLNKWVGKVFTWEEKKFDSNGNLTLGSITVPANTKDVQIMITYYADWSSGSENLLDKSSITIDSIKNSSASTTTTPASTVTTVTTTPISTTTTTNGGSTTGAVWGDANCDGSVKSNDLLLLKKYLLGLATLSDQALKNCDLTHDGSVKSNDLLKLKKYLLGLVSDSELAN